MLIVTIRIPREIDPYEILPKDAYPSGAQPHWAPKEFHAKRRDRAEADMLVNSMRAQPGVSARIVGDPI